MCSSFGKSPVSHAAQLTHREAPSHCIFVRTVQSAGGNDYLYTHLISLRCTHVQFVLRDISAQQQ